MGYFAPFTCTAPCQQQKALFSRIGGTGSVSEETNGFIFLLHCKSDPGSGQGHSPADETEVPGFILDIQAQGNGRQINEINEMGHVNEVC